MKTIVNSIVAKAYKAKDDYGVEGRGVKIAKCFQLS